MLAVFCYEREEADGAYSGENHVMEVFVTSTGSQRHFSLSSLFSFTSFSLSFFLSFFSFFFFFLLSFLFVLLLFCFVCVFFLPSFLVVLCWSCSMTTNECCVLLRAIRRLCDAHSGATKVDSTCYRMDLSREALPRRHLLTNTQVCHSLIFCCCCCRSSLRGSRPRLAYYYNSSLF